MSEVFYLCTVCGERHRTMEPCAEKEVTSVPHIIKPLTPVELLAEIAFLGGRHNPESFDALWQDIARAVAIEVLRDPSGYARALGLDLPCRSDDSAPVAGLG